MGSKSFSFCVIRRLCSSELFIRMKFFGILTLSGAALGATHSFGQNFQESCASKSRHEVDYILGDVMQFVNSERSFYLTQALMKKQGEKKYSGSGDFYNQTCTTDPGSSDKSACPPGGCNVLLDLSGIWNYGCWCNFGENLMEGSGKPVNRFDEVCQRYQSCLRCARNDASDGGYSCNPKTDSYNAISGPNFKVKCSSANPGDDCGTHMCTCSHNLISELLEFIWDQEPYDPSKLHSEGFDRAAECPVAPGNHQTTTECCGTYPARVPYNSANKNCCTVQATGEQTHVYHPTFFQCCDDGNTAAPGTCP